MSELVTVVAGSGVAAAAGLPTLHGLDSSRLNNTEFEHVLTAKQYGNYLPEFWQFAKANVESALAVSPSTVHLSLAEQKWPIITQNIGGIHKRAGSETVVEVYGSLFTAKCMRCHEMWDINLRTYVELTDDSPVPACPKCGRNRVRPSISLPDEKEQHRRLAESMLNTANTVVYLGVDENSGPVTDWHHKVPNSVLVSPVYWGNFDIWFEMTPNEWAEAGMPTHRSCRDYALDDVVASQNSGN